MNDLNYFPSSNVGTNLVLILHSFLVCRSCIVQRLQKKQKCPICEVQVNKTPVLSLRWVIFFLSFHIQLVFWKLSSILKIVFTEIRSYINYWAYCILHNQREIVRLLRNKIIFRKINDSYKIVGEWNIVPNWKNDFVCIERNENKPFSNDHSANWRLEVIIILDCINWELKQ